MSSFFWYGVIAHNTILVISGKGESVVESGGGVGGGGEGEEDGREKNNKISFRTHMVVWLPALFCAVLPQVWPGADGYGPVDRGGYECWIPDGDYEFLRWTYYGPLVVIIFQSLYLLWLVGKLR